MDATKKVLELIENWARVCSPNSRFLEQYNRDKITFKEFVEAQAFIMEKLGITTAQEHEDFWEEFKAHTTTDEAIDHMLKAVVQVMYDWWFIIGGVSEFCPPDFDRNKISFAEFEAVQEYVTREKGIHSSEKQEEFWNMFKALTTTSIYR